MLGTARGVSLGLGKINLAALNSGLQNRDGLIRAKRKREKERCKTTTKKYIHIEGAEFIHTRKFSTEPTKRPSTRRDESIPSRQVDGLRSPI
uniref:Uncharacterized protein n=1 Tax=Setaria digitata TaxID=48799 RepID=A0A915PZL9_9BILA